MSQLYVVVLAVIVVVLLSVALYRTSQVKTKADYLVAALQKLRRPFDLLRTLSRNSHRV